MIQPTKVIRPEGAKAEGFRKSDGLANDRRRDLVWNPPPMINPRGCRISPRLTSLLGFVMTWRDKESWMDTAWAAHERSRRVITHGTDDVIDLQVQNLLLGDR